MRTFWVILTSLFILGCTTEAPPPAPTPAPAPSESFSKTVDTGQSCGGMLGVTCAKETDYCHYEIADMCGAADAPGTCTARPEVCTMEYDPVCGCDDQTYSNACMASAEGVSVIHKGECAP